MLAAASSMNLCLLGLRCLSPYPFTKSSVSFFSEVMPVFIAKVFASSISLLRAANNFIASMHFALGILTFNLRPTKNTSPTCSNPGGAYPTALSFSHAQPFPCPVQKLRKTHCACDSPTATPVSRSPRNHRRLLRLSRPALQA